MQRFYAAERYLVGFGKEGEEYKHYFSETWFDPVADRHNWKEERKIVQELVDKGMYKYA